MRELLSVGPERLAAMVMRGELKGRHVRLAVKGFTRYARAIRMGDVADKQTKRFRAATCEGCERVTRRDTAAGYTAWYCGEPFTEGADNPQGGCGCLVLLTVDGQTIAAGKTEVRSETCPHGFW